MGDIYVKFEGKWATFSSVTGSFITPFMNEDQHNRWRRQKQGKKNYKPMAEDVNKKTMSEAVYLLSLSKEFEEAVKNLTDAGITYDKAKELWRQYAASCKRQADKTDSEINKQTERKE